MLFINIMANLSHSRKNLFAFIRIKTSFEVLLKLEIYVFILILYSLIFLLLLDVFKNDLLLILEFFVCLKFL